MSSKFPINNQQSTINNRVIFQVECRSKVFWIGIGCQRGTPKSVIETAIVEVFANHHLAIDRIKGVATIDSKADEVGLVEFCRDRNLPLVTFSTELLKSINVPNSSQIVSARMGTFSVAEAAAICAAKSDLIVPKQIFKQVGEVGAVTVAIARSSITSFREYQTKN
ncbi:cobalamin biosynthesis protein [Merismopedia glauca]|uniref:cobalamin biosynthesis protein n=1 Tax=Merismopedia glauca TaxID=292586 RepID=UPI001FEBB28C|nr:cobalamin biosynthesis protein [Merismopedia glauca]